MIHFDMPPMRSNIIKVLGFGGGGSNAVNHMYKQNIENVDFIICNTDAQSLATSDVPIKIQLGPHLTQGLGAGANPEVGKQATEESLEEIRRMLEVNTKMAFITAGMGGGTGTGGAPAIAKVCREMGILTVGIVTTPFGFEGPKRMKHAQAGIDELKLHVDTLLVINNDKLRQQYGNLKMKEAFQKADDVLATAARCITDIINSIGQINVDFADVCTVMKDGGVAILGSAITAGENRALRAIEEAINSPLLNDNDIRGAKWILLNITSAEGEFEYTMDEVDAIQSYVRSQTGDDTDVILGIGYDSNLSDQLGVTIIATGFGHKDPFTPITAPKKQPLVVVEAPKPEKVIIGVLGENQPTTSADQPDMTTLPIENANPLAPILMENVPAPNIVEPIRQEENVEPVFMMLSDAKNEPATVQPAAEEIKPKEYIKAEPLELQFTLKEEPILDGDAIRNELESTVKFLARPSQIYVAPPAQPVVNEVEETIAQPIQEPEQPIVLEIRTPEEPKKQEPKKSIFGDDDSFDMSMVVKDENEPIKMETRPNNPFKQQPPAVAASFPTEMSEEEEQKRRAQERVDKIKKLRNLSFNFNASDPNNEFEQVPAYMRREYDLHNSIANVENFYSRAQVKTDDKDQTSISTINTFLDGKNPD